jgi:hypothetical protein
MKASPAAGCVGLSNDKECVRIRGVGGAAKSGSVVGHQDRGRFKPATANHRVWRTPLCVTQWMYRPERIMTTKRHQTSHDLIQTRS